MRILKEKAWKFNLPNDLRNAIRDEDYLNVLNTLKDNVKVLFDNGIMEDIDYEDFIDDIDNQIDNLQNYEDYDMTLEDVVDEIDYILNEFYDWCDANSVWIEI